MNIPELLNFAGAVLTTLMLVLVLAVGNPVRRTSLTAAWRWGITAVLAWSLTTIGTAWASRGSPLLDQLWLWTAILTICPLIAVLGARRPASRVWSWFILLPLMAVLGWPAFTVMWHWPVLVPLKVQAPIGVGFGLITLMGMGNYIGTRFTVPAILAGIAIFLALVPLSTRAALNRESTQLVHAAASLVAATAFFSALRQGLRTGAEESPYDRLWFDFRDTFGIVWSVRIQDRLNETAEKEAWCCRLGPDGFHWNPVVSTEHRQETRDRLEHALRWHLRRFVDPEWIDERFMSSAARSAVFLPGTNDPIPKGENKQQIK